MKDGDDRPTAWDVVPDIQEAHPPSIALESSTSLAGGCQSITRMLLITAVSRRQKVRDGSTTLYSLSVGCEHEPIACTGHAEPCEGSIRRCRIAESSGRRFPRTVAQLWLTLYRAWSDALSA